MSGGREITDAELNLVATALILSRAKAQFGAQPAHSQFIVKADQSLWRQFVEESQRVRIERDHADDVRELAECEKRAAELREKLKTA